MSSDRTRARQARNQGAVGAVSVSEGQGAETVGQKTPRLGRTRLILDTIIAQRKFTLALLFGISGITGLFVDKLEGDQFNFLVGIVLSIFGAANVAEKRVK